MSEQVFVTAEEVKVGDTLAPPYQRYTVTVSRFRNQTCFITARKAPPLDMEEVVFHVPPSQVIAIEPRKVEPTATTAGFIQDAMTFAKAAKEFTDKWAPK